MVNIFQEDIYRTTAPLNDRDMDQSYRRAWNVETEVVKGSAIWWQTRRHAQMFFLVQAEFENQGALRSQSLKEENLKPFEHRVTSVKISRGP